MQTNKADFELFVEDDVEWDVYLQRMLQDGCWGGEQEITALCLLMKCNCVAFRANGAEQQFEMHPPMGSVPTVRISFELGNHFNSVVL